MLTTGRPAVPPGKTSHARRPRTARASPRRHRGDPDRPRPRGLAPARARRAAVRTGRRGPQDRPDRDRARRRHREVRPDHRLRHPADRSRGACAFPQLRFRRPRPGLPCRGRPRRRPGRDPAGRDRELPGLPPRQRPGRHPQHDRGLRHGELLGDGDPPRRRRGDALRRPRRLSERRRRRRLRPRHRLRHGGRRPGLRQPSARALGPCHPPERRRRGLRRPRLRGDAGRADEVPLRYRPRRPLPRPDHPGDRRHHQDRGDDRRPDPRAAPRGEPRHPRARPRLRAPPRPAMRRLRRLLRHHRQPRPRRRLRSARRHGRHRDPLRELRRSTAPSSCCSAAPPAPRSRTS